MYNRTYLSGGGTRFAALLANVLHLVTILILRGGIWNL